MSGGLTIELLKSDLKLVVKFDIIEYVGKNSINVKATNVELVKSKPWS